jgi:hypothetical protein
MPDFSIDSPPLGHQQGWMRPLPPSAPPPLPPLKETGIDHIPVLPPVWVTEQVKRQASPVPEPPLEQDEPGSVEPDADGDAQPKAEAAAEAEAQPSPNGDAAAGSASDAPRRERYVKTSAIRAAVQGREADVVRAIGIAWHGRDHIRCPFPGHDGHNPSWRWDDEKGCCFCTCDGSAGSIFDVVMRIEGGDFEAAKIRVAEIIGRDDLIVDPAAEQGATIAQIAEEKKLPIEQLHKAGWFDMSRRGKYHDKPPAIGIPYLDRGDNPRANSRHLRVRIAITGPKRFVWRKGDVAKHGKAPLYGAWNLISEPPKYIVLVEGETDCITLWMRGIPALGIPGAPYGWNEDRHAPLLDGIEHIVVVVEPGGAGSDLLKRLAGSSIAPRLRVIYMPAETKDPNALWSVNPDPAAFQASFMPLLNAAEPIDPEKHKASKSEAADPQPGGAVLRVHAGSSVHFPADRRDMAGEQRERALADY